MKKGRFFQKNRAFAAADSFHLHDKSQSVYGQRFAQEAVRRISAQRTNIVPCRFRPKKVCIAQINRSALFAAA